MKRTIAVVGAALCLLASPTWAAPDPAVRESVAVCSPDTPANCEAPYYASAVTLTVGGSALAHATKGIAADCSGGGTATLTMSDGSSMNWTVAAGHQNQPYSVTGVSASTATCTFYGLN